MNIYIQVAYSYIHVPECSTICIQSHSQWLCIVHWQAEAITRAKTKELTFKAGQSPALGKGRAFYV